MADTTVKIDIETRDRLATIAAARGTSVRALLAEIAVQEENQLKLREAATAAFHAVIVGKKLTVRDYFAIVAAVTRHRVNTPHIEIGRPDTYWRVAALLEQLVLLRPLPARNEYFAYGVAVACIRASGETVDASYKPWRADHRHPRAAPDGVRHRRPAPLPAPRVTDGPKRTTGPLCGPGPPIGLDPPSRQGSGRPI
jgi:hypothetical protein